MADANCAQHGTPRSGAEDNSSLPSDDRHHHTSAIPLQQGEEPGEGVLHPTVDTLETPYVFRTGVPDLYSFNFKEEEIGALPQPHFYWDGASHGLKFKS
jgi:hypothetical protein